MRRIIVLFVFFLLICGIVHSQPTLQWDFTYDNLGKNSDFVNDMVIDPFGDIIVVGTKSIVAIGAGENDIVTIKLNPAGDTVWVRVYDDDSTDYGYSVGVDAIGNIYVSGSTVSKATGLAIPILIKYYPNGTMAWTRNGYPIGFTPYIGGFHDMVVDPAGIIYLTGNGWIPDGLSGKQNALTVKYNSDGALLMYSLTDFSITSSFIGKRIHYDGSGNIYVTGRASAIGGTDIFTVKYNNIGTILWVDIYNGPGNQYDISYDIITDTSENVYVCGGVDNTFGMDRFWVAQFSPTGIFNWEKNLGTSDIHPGAIARSMELTSDGNVLVAGDMRAPSEDLNAYLIKITPSGVILWDVSYGLDDKPESIYDLAIDLAGNMYLGGYCLKSVPQNFDMFAVKFDSNGSFIWEISYNGSGSDYDYATSISVDNNNNVYLAGVISMNNISPILADYGIIKYSQTSQSCCIDFRGNVDNDALDEIDISDLVYLVAYMFQEGVEPPCMEEADIDGSGGDPSIDISDLVALVAYMFQGGDQPADCP